MLKPIITVPQLPAQLYRSASYRVVHSVEEYSQCIAEGWSATPEPDTRHIPHTAISIPPGDSELALVSLPEEPAKEEPVADENRIIRPVPSQLAALGKSEEPAKTEEQRSAELAKVIKARLRVPIKFKPAEPTE